ncbi:MAG: extracellular solute-binding protein [Planctomycetes bacterium]|nr:extracellular solute-binding protein [Planctomycetota bacterium]
MREWTPRLVIVGLLVLVLGVPFALRPRGEAAVRNADPADRLVIATPHNEHIRYEFARAFNRWRVAHGKAVIDFDWRSSGGASDLRKQVLAEFQKAGSAGADDSGIGKDLFFGGGDVEHDILARGATIEKSDKTKTAIAVTVPIRLPPGLLGEAFPEPTIGGAPLYHAKLQWIGVALSSFGIIYNRDALAMLHLPEPTTWQDLADPRYRGWLALADPSHSGSVAATLNTILRREGWSGGWSLLRRLSANARYFTNSASKVPVDVSAGEAAAGMCIDFYGRFQVGAIGGDPAAGGNSRVGYVDPPGNMTAITPDPISLFRGAPHRELAEEFIAWLLSPEAQGLWQRRIGVPDGPERYELRRLPARRDMYNEIETATWRDRDIKPFEVAREFPAGMPSMFSLVAPVMQAVAIDTHDELVEAWKVINDESDPARRTAMMARFEAMPPELAFASADTDVAALKMFIDGLAGKYKGEAGAQRLLRDRLSWRAFFSGNYRAVVAMGRE